MITLPLRFDGPEATRADRARLTDQHERIKALMLDGRWRSLAEISATTKAPQSSVSAQLRHLRKPRFGSYLVERKRVTSPLGGLFVYRVAAGPGDDREAPENRPDTVARLRARLAALELQVRDLRALVQAGGARP